MYKCMDNMLKTIKLSMFAIFLWFYFPSNLSINNINSLLVCCNSNSNSRVSKSHPLSLKVKKSIESTICASFFYE